MTISVPSAQIRTAASEFLARQHGLLIDGRWTQGQTTERIEVVNPSTGEVFASVAAGTAADVDAAVAAARRAFTSGPWAKMKADQRAALINRLADLIEATADEIAWLESLDGGNPLASVRRRDVAFAIPSLRAAASWADKVTGEVLSAPAGAGFSYSVREPLGVAGLITPWNAPFIMAVNKLGPALAVGCTCVLKPAELAPLTALRLGELIQEAGFPDGVVNIITGHGHVAGQALSEHRDVNKISFTGSTRVGRSIVQASAINMKRVTLELGGKSPIIVFADADLDRAAAAIADETCYKSGQFCAGGTRLFVHSSVHDGLIDRLVQRLEKVKVGPGSAPDTDMGPLISQKQLDRVLGYIEAGRASGATLATGGRRLEGAGYFVAPTIFTGAEAGFSIMQDEIFGPVLSATSFDDGADLAAVAARANDTEYGLAAKLWTRDLATAHQMARLLQAGTITINGGGGDGALPFGGFKQSGLGREKGRPGVESFTELKSVSIGY